VKKVGKVRSQIEFLNTMMAPAHWNEPCVHTEPSLHQLSPYIGKTKSTIATDLVNRYSKVGDLVIDPFAGAGTILYGSAISGRRSFGADVSPYAAILAKAKLAPPRNLEEAIEKAENALDTARRLPRPDLRRVPKWVRLFFHPETLREALQFSEICRKPGNEFLMACFLGILHHQRPGFLSYPSSHLVPYLRDKKFPRSDFPEMYTYRELRPRLLAKVQRAYKRFRFPPRKADAGFYCTSVQNLRLPKQFDALITSPPYMNALDYGRDNRLRLWFIEPTFSDSVDNDATQNRRGFIDAITSLVVKVEKRIKPNGYCVFIVGEAHKRKFDAHPSEEVFRIVNDCASSLKLKNILTDEIPDVRRTRRECSGVKVENVLVFQRI
jgi:hypothetical protein